MATKRQAGSRVQTFLERSPGFNEIWQQVREGQNNLLVSGLSGSAKSFLASAFLQKQLSVLLYLTADSAAAAEVYSDLQTLLPGQSVLLFPARENPLYGIQAASPELLAERQRVLYALAEGQECVVVAPVEALLYQLPAPTEFAARGLRLFRGQQISPENLSRSLVQGGYERVALVEHPGQFSRRGGILDIYGPGYESPLRLEFFGDEIDLIKEFDLTSQRSLENINETVTVIPAQESIWPALEQEQGLLLLGQALERAGKKHPDLAVQLADHVGSDRARLQEGIIFSGRERYLPFFSRQAWSLLDYLPSDARVIIDEPSRLWEQLEQGYRFFCDGYTDLLAGGRVLAEQLSIAFTPDNLVARLPEGKTIFFALFPRRAAPWSIQRQMSLSTKSVQSFYGQSQLFKQEIERLTAGDYTLLIMGGDEEKLGRLKSYLASEGLHPLTGLDERAEKEAGIILLPGDLNAGFELAEARLMILTAANLLERLKVGKRPRLSKAEGARLSDYRDLSVGDYVVHVQHGIGQYLGIKTLEIEGLQRDYLQVKYAGADRLYVPTDQIELLQKYVGSEGRTPRIYSLGGGDWQRVKNRVKESVREMAGELLKLYATRREAAGFAFPPDSEWQEEMESRFAYRVTPDQGSAIRAVKTDLESQGPMDRLLLGDVGYGKTEVALRAAFKAAMGGKQVAILVPTTILAEQHHATFQERFAGFPLEVGLLSRFRSPAENRHTVERLSKGLVDVVIGTHRLLQKDVKFYDLGLLIIDEEQRFGVAHKERLKFLKENVDTLTLTATPIPRTLHMAMAGMRDMSVIETPPDNRFPVQTYVVEHNDELVRTAIRRELERRGQVYYVHNRVRSIARAVDRLAKLLPDARIAYGHGRMTEAALERLMLDFVQGEYDVLVSTTIIESGLDIPNVNTLIVEDADKFGLAQLYQLRGRVGRSNRVAFAYFTYKPEKALSEVAEKRLQAIKEFTELGAGFKIAMRDLEIRGAGNILGPEQHGFMVAVGFGLYCRLLEEAVRELQGQAPLSVPETEIDLPIDAYIPDRYVPDGRQKIEMYKKIRAARELADVDDIWDELSDRYGTLPGSVENLLLATRIRVLAEMHEIARLSIKDKGLRMQLAPGGSLSPGQIQHLFHESGGGFRLLPQRPGVLVWQDSGLNPLALAGEWLRVMLALPEN